MRGRTVCYHHGGKSLRGADHPGLKHPERNKYLPHRLLDVYTEVLADPEYMDLTRDAALLESFARETLMTMQDAPDAASVWARMRERFDALQNALTAADVSAIGRAMNDIRKVIDERSRYHAARKEIRVTLAEKRQTVESITRAETARERTFTVVEIATLMAAIVALIQREVRDTREQYALLSGVEKLITIEAE